MVFTNCTVRCLSAASRPLLVLALLGLMYLPSAPDLLADPGTSAVAVDEKTPPSNDRQVTQEIIEARRSQAASAPDLSEEIRKKVGEFYRQATESLHRASELAGNAATFKQDADQVQDRVRKIQEEIAGLRDKTPAAPPAAQLPDLEQEIAKLTRQMGELKQAQAAAEAGPSTRANRRKEARTLLASSPQKLQEIDQQLGAAPPQDESPLLTLARRTELLARRVAVEQEVPALQNELAKYDAEDSVDLVRLQRDLRIQEVTFAERYLQLLDGRAKQLRDEAAREAVRQAQEEVIQAQPLLKAFATRNQELAEEARDVTRDTEQTQKESQKLAAQLEEIDRQFTQTKDRVESVGLTGSVGALLRKQRSTLPDARKQRQRIRARRQVIDDGRFKLFELDDERRELAKPEVLVAQVLRQADNLLKPSERDHLGAAAENVLQRKREYLDALIRNYNAYFDALILLDTTEQQLVNRAEQFITYIDERVLWIRSGKPLNSGFALSETELSLLRAEPWLNLIQRMRSEVSEHAGVSLSALAGFGGLFTLRRRLRRRNGELGLLAERKTCIRYGVTVRSSLTTLLIAAPWPALTALAAWRMTAAGSGTEPGRALATSLWILALVFLPVEVLRQVCRPGGLAIAHFGWPKSAVQTLRSHVFLLMALAMPLVFMTTLLYVSSPEHGNDTLGRFFFIAASVVVAFFFGNVLRSQGGVLREYLAYHPDGWTDRFKHAWRWIGVAAPLALASLAFFGYYYTAIQLTWRLYLSILYVVFLVILRSLLLRLLLVHRRDLSMRQARERRAAILAAQDPPLSGDIASQSVILPVDDGANLAQLSTQTQRLLTTAVLVGSLMALWCIWVDVFPALGVTDRWPLWTTVSTVTETATDASGQTQVVTRDVLEKITLADLLLAFLIGCVTFVACRNIPGLLEMSILQRLPLEASMRYAMTTIASYTIIILGVVMACSTIGLRWSQIQWLATALTFGLAFGLQEIFANFVAGLIILFERPIRVGDVVTVADVTGVVSRMRIRATTITDGDRRELIVPNREFITGRLLNWTLSDKVNRIVIEVGIAYGSDTERARTLLQTIAKEHSLVLDNPAPTATLEGFGDHALKLVLRVYLANLDCRTHVQHELYTAIHTQFAEAGIEIAFPHLDLRVRSVETGLLRSDRTPIPSLDTGREAA